MTADSEPPFVRWLHRKRRADGRRWSRMTAGEVVADIQGRAREAAAQARRRPPPERRFRLAR